VSPFDADAIRKQYDAGTDRIEFHESIPSTNDRARELARAGEGTVAVVAGEQIAGRGRRGRTWTGPPGGVYLSILLDPDLDRSEYPLLTLAAGVATVRAVRAFEVEAGIKWPNDVLVDGGKLAGILTERVGDRVIVGVGINADVDPADLPNRAVSLRSLTDDVDRAGLVADLLSAFEQLCADPDGILPAWRDDAVTLGRSVRVETPTGVVEGTAVDVERPGRLLVDTGDEVVGIDAGDCEHLRPA